MQATGDTDIGLVEDDRMLGLYDGDFTGYRVATDSEIRDALQTAIIAVDANVLLNLYRYRRTTSDDLLKILKKLGDRLLVPHQALREFWRHRQRSAQSPQAATENAVSSLTKATTAMQTTLESWSKQVGVEQDELSKMNAKIVELAEAIKDELHQLGEGSPAEDLRSDPILKELESLLLGRVTERPTDIERNRCLVEARRRVEAEEPPGYLDRGKESDDSEDGAAGDYLVWYQATRYAQSADSDLIIVTADEKEDWWWRQRSQFVGPRPELTLEYQELCGRRLILLRPSDLLSRADSLDVQIDADSVADASRPTEVVNAKWTRDYVEQVLEQLSSDSPAQYQAVRRAIQNRGRVSRDEVYLLGGYADDRTLTSFTKPVRRLTRTLQDEGKLPPNLSPLLVSEYSKGETKVSFFAIPPEVPPLYDEHTFPQYPADVPDDGTLGGLNVNPRPMDEFDLTRDPWLSADRALVAKLRAAVEGRAVGGLSGDRASRILADLRRHSGGQPMEDTDGAGGYIAGDNASDVSRNLASDEDDIV